MRDLDFLNYEIRLNFKSKLVDLEEIENTRKNSIDVLHKLFKIEEIDNEIMVSSYFRENHQVLYVFFDNVSVNNMVEKKLLIESFLGGELKISNIKDVSVKVSQDSCPPDMFNQYIPVSNSSDFILLKTPSENLILYFEGKLKATNDKALRMCYVFLMNEDIQPEYGILSIEPNIEDKEELAKISDLKSISNYFEFV